MLLIGYQHGIHTIIIIGGIMIIGIGIIDMIGTIIVGHIKIIDMDIEVIELVVEQYQDIEQQNSLKL